MKLLEVYKADCVGKIKLENQRRVNSCEHNSGGSIFMSRGGSIPVSGDKSEAQ
jgi:hypothetical protein